MVLNRAVVCLSSLVLASIAPTSEAAAQSEVALPAVNVTAGTGSKDGAATENSGSYATDVTGVGSKASASTREIPQTVTVITRKRMDDQNLTSIEDAMRETTGMTVLSVDPARFDLYSRGHRVDSIQVDGVSANLNNFFVTPDLAVYDRIEVMKGPNALFSGSGNPGATVNLARKRALDIWQVQGNGAVGSRNYRRGEFDVTGPLHPSKRIRARVVGAYEDKDLIYSPSYYRKPTLYGTLEMDLTEQTTLSLGAIYTAVNYLPFAGLPAYANGTLLAVPRSTLVGASWNSWKTSTLDKFGELEHRFDNGARAKLSARQVDRKSDAIYLTPSSAVNPVTGMVNLNRIRLDLEHRNTTVDLNYSTPFHLFGQTHNFLVGVDRRDFTYTLRNGSGAATTQNVFSPNNDLPFIPVNLTGGSQTQEQQRGAYTQLRVKPVSWATLIAGARFSDWSTAGQNLITGARSAVADVKGKVTANYGVVFDVTRDVSLYASYADIFQPQTAVAADGSVLPPRVGWQREAGIKTSLLDDKLKAHAALFQIRDVNRAMTDPSNPTFSIAAGEAESRGFETEVTGRIARGWDVTAGYAFTQTEYLNESAANIGQPLASFTPAHAYNFWTRYEFEHGPLEGLSLGLGGKIVSSFYTRSGNVRWTQEGYEIFSAQLGYKFSPNVWATLTITNLFDRTYYAWVNTSTSGNRYGEPRTAMLKVSAKW